MSEIVITYYIHDGRFIDRPHKMRLDTSDFDPNMSHDEVESTVHELVHEHMLQQISAEVSERSWKQIATKVWGSGGDKSDE